MSMRKATLSVYDTNLCYAPSTCKRRTFRTTQIISYIKPEATKEDIITMIEAGLNIACFDATEGKSGLNSIEETLKTFKDAVKEYNTKRCNDLKAQMKQNEDCDPKIFDCIEVHIATALDCKGNFLETGTFEKEATFEVGTTIELTINKDHENSSGTEMVYVNYPNLTSLRKGQVIIINGCTVCSVIENKDENSICCKVTQMGTVPAGKKVEVNIQGQSLGIDGVCDDLQSLATFCRNNDVNMMLMAVNDFKTIKSIQCVVNPEGTEKRIKVISKIESFDALKNLEKLIEKSDGVLIGRKRLGRNILPEQVPAYQKMIISKCLKTGIPSIVANHMLGKLGYETCGASRAETTDLFNAVLDGADCVMLDLKTSNVEAINSMKFTIMEAEDMTNYRRWNRDLITQVAVPCAPIHCGYFTDSLAIAATTCAMVNGASAIIVLTDTGRTARYISKYRPECPIIVVTKNTTIAQQCLLHRGVFSMCSEKFPESYEKNINEKINAGIMLAKSCFIIKKLPACVVVVYATKENPGKSDTMKIIFIENDKKPEEPEEKCGNEDC